MKHLKSISLALVLLCTAGLFAQSAPASKGAAPFVDPVWAAARKNMLSVYTDYIHAAERDEEGKGGVLFNTQMHALLDATDQIHKAQATMIAQPGAVYRDIFAKDAVMCQRSALLYWQSTARQDTTPGHFYTPPTPDVAACMKRLALPDPETF